MRATKAFVSATLMSTGLVLLSPLDARAFDSHLAQGSLKEAASRLRELANEKATSAPKGPASAGTKEWDWYSQTAWLKKAAGRCDALAQQMDQPDMKRLEKSYLNLRKALLNESSSNGERANEFTIRTRQDKATSVIQALK